MYHYRYGAQLTAEEDTSVSIRVRLSGPTVKALQERLQEACKRDDARLVRRVSVLLEHLADGIPVEAVSARWGVSPACVYQWLHAFLLKGMESLVYRHAGGRPAKLTPTQKKRLCELIDAGPQAAGFGTACWNSLLIELLIEQEFGVAYNRFYVCQLLGNLGYSFQKARFVSDHLDEARRQQWMREEWPRILKEARRRRALILFGDEASFPQWGSLSYTWARRGHQPEVKTSGKRKGYKVFGLIDYFSGRFFYEGTEGKFASESYAGFLQRVLTKTTEPLFLIQDGAKYHTSKAMQEFFATQRARLTVYQLPSYSPDYNPIEYLWRNLKKRATHDQYFPLFSGLIASVDKELAYFVEHSQEVLKLFGCYCTELGLDPDLAA